MFFKLSTFSKVYVRLIVCFHRNLIWCHFFFFFKRDSSHQVQSKAGAEITAWAVWRVLRFLKIHPLVLILPCCPPLFSSMWKLHCRVSCGKEYLFLAMHFYDSFNLWVYDYACLKKLSDWWFHCGLNSCFAGERKKLSFTTPDRIALGSPNTNNCTVSPFVEGCSPIKSCAPVQHPGGAWVQPQCRTSPLQMSPTVDKESIHPDSTLPTTELDLSSAPMPSHSGRYKAVLHDIIELDDSNVAVPNLMHMEKGDNNSVNMEGPAETQEDYSTWSRDEVDSSPMRLTSSRTGSMTNMENSNMFVSLLAEGSTMPYDSSMQVCIQL